MSEWAGSAEPGGAGPGAGHDDMPGHSDGAQAAETAHAHLRRVTRPWHDGVEHSFGAFDLQTVAGLAGFLQRQAAALVPLEVALERAGVSKRLPDWPARRRAGVLAADLAQLGFEAPAVGTPPRLPTEHHRLGALYVLEGSKLGGRVLCRRVQASPDPRVRAATRFLGHRHDGGWAAFLAVLNAGAAEPNTRADLVEGARVAFAVFQAAAGNDPASRFADGPTRFGLYRRAHA